jgi:regulator of cell morphogenesis and NO signaling
VPSIARTSWRANAPAEEVPVLASIDPESTVAQIVTDHPAAARVFQKYRIDFCCHGDVGLHKACAGRGLDAWAVANELVRALAEGAFSSQESASRLPTSELIAYIVQRHHGYLRDALPYVLPLAAKVARVHGERNPALVPLNAAVRLLEEMLLPHLEREENELFPGLSASPDSEWAHRELALMQEEHVAVGQLLARIRDLGSGFSTPEWGCKTYRVLMHELEALEADILCHVHLENHVLAPRFAPAVKQPSIAS